MRHLRIFPILFFCAFLTLLFFSRNVFAQLPPSSDNYKVLDYGFGGGGIASASSSNYSIFGTVGQVDQGSPSSQNYFIGAGLEYEVMASAPASPTFVNPSNWYNKLRLTIIRGGNDPNDYEYAIQIASGAGAFKYVQNDNTVGNDLNDEDWQTYSAWGAGSGFNIIGLYPGTTYTARVASRHSQFFTQSDWGPTAQAATENSTLSFDIDVAASDTETSAPYILDMGGLTPGSVTTSNQKVWIDISTNATNGGLISITGANNGLASTTTSHTISSGSVDLTAQPSGYGARSTSTTQTSGGPMAVYAPYDGSGNNVGVIDTSKRFMFYSTHTAVIGGRVSFELKAKASSTTPAASDYTDTLTILATGSF